MKRSERGHLPWSPETEDKEPRAGDAKDAEVKKAGNCSETNILGSYLPLRPLRPLGEAFPSCS
jgi:hypothetical protein